jgi:hypothetical protein
MTYLLWRQHRRQMFASVATLAALAILMIASGAAMESSYHSALASCRAGVACSDVLDSLFQTNWDRAIIVLAVLTIAVPAVLAVFWGAPLLAREAEDGTIKLAWTQTVSRRRWFAMKAGAMLAAAGIGGAAVAGLVSWWARPMNVVHQSRFSFGQFDLQGIVPIGYAVFAVALGIACGVWLRRTLAALGVTLAGFIAVRFVIEYGLRPRYMTPITLNRTLGSVNFKSGTGPQGSSWGLDNYLLDPSGHVMHGVGPQPGSCPIPRPGNFHAFTQCLGSLGWRSVTVFQPANRYWTFQGIETGIFLALAAVAITVAYFLVTRRDA